MTHTKGIAGSTGMSCSEHELLAMIDDLQQAHAQCMPRVHEALGDLHDEVADQQREGLRASRRVILMAGGATLGGLALAACGGSKKSPGGTPAPSSAGSSGGLTGDFKVVGLAAALENAAVFAYGQGIAAATAGKLGKVPPAVVKFATTALAQHKDHALAWNGFLQSNGKTAVTDIPLTILPAINTQLAAVADVPGLAKFARGLENVAAATYISAAAGVSAAAGIATALTIAPVEAQHVAILDFVLGTYPVPNALYDTTAAVGVEIFTG